MGEFRSHVYILQTMLISCRACLSIRPFIKCTGVGIDRVEEIVEIQGDDAHFECKEESIEERQNKVMRKRRRRDKR